MYNKNITIRIEEDTILSNVSPYTTVMVGDEENPQFIEEPIHPAIEDLTQLKAMAISTINWVIGQEVKKGLSNEFTKMSAVSTKAVVLLAKVLQELTDTTGLTTLTTKEQTAFDNIVALANTGYADSDLLINSFAVLDAAFAKYQPMIDDVTNATSTTKVLDVLASL